MLIAAGDSGPSQQRNRLPLNCLRNGVRHVAVPDVFFRIWRPVNFCIILILFFSTITPCNAASNLLDDINVVDTPNGYNIVIQFLSPIFYQRHQPLREGNSLAVQLRQSSANVTQENSSGVEPGIKWNSAFGVPLIDVTLEDTNIESPKLILRFSKKVKFSVFNGGDNHSITVSIETSRPLFNGPQPIEPERGSPPNIITSLKLIDPNMATRLDRANEAMLNKDYSRAVQLLTRIRQDGNDAIKPHTQELIGLAREYNGQLAHAKAEYEKYLADFPTGEASDRVRQRLIALSTAADAPKPSRQQLNSQHEQAGGKWTSQFYGDIGQYYFRNEIQRPRKDWQLMRSNIMSQFNLVGRTRNDNYDIKLQFSGNYLSDLLNNNEDTFYPSQIALDGRIKKWGLYTRLGRQSRQSGGVLGRFDGIHAAYDINGFLTVNVVSGYPVDFNQRDKINKQQSFTGVSLDIGTLWGGWEFKTYYIEQDYIGVKDRESIGTEIQYFDTDKSLFTLVDYDIYHKELNMFSSNGRWNLSPNTSLNFSFDQRRSPILLTRNALIGQGQNQLDDLLQIYSAAEILQLAKDRTAELQTSQIGITQQIGKNWQFNFETTASEYSGMPASAGVAEIESTGQEFYYATRLIGSNILLDNDSAIFGLRYADTSRAQISSLETYWRFNLYSNIRLNPRLRLDYRQNTANKTDRWFARPNLKIDYKLNAKIHCELDLGYDWLEETFVNTRQQLSGYYLRAGYWLQF